MNKILIKRIIGFAGGLAVCILLWNAPLSGLPVDGRRCLALSLAAVIWWAAGVMNPGYTALALLLFYSLFLNPEIAPRSLIFNLWTSPTIYLVIGGFLIAAAVQRSGLGKRIALKYILRFVKSYKSIVISCYLLGLLLSFIIPHPWPRSFLLVSVMAYVIKAAGLEGQSARNVGLTIFVGSIPTSMVLLTGDSTLNSAVSGFVGSSVSYLQWIVYMGLPGLLAVFLTCTFQLCSFKGPEKLSIDFNEVRGELRALGKLSGLEKRTIAAIMMAVLLWCTDTLHGINPGWVAVITAVVLALPTMDVLDAASWSQVNLGTLLFLCAALAIGSVGGATGMNEWIVGLLLPGQVSSNPYIFALLCMIICMVVHMLLGSTLAVLGIVTPAIMAFGSMAGIPPLASAFIAYTSVSLHWLLPFHHMNLLVGVGEHFDERQALRLGALQTVVVALVVLFEVFWWSAIGLI